MFIVKIGGLRFVIEIKDIFYLIMAVSCAVFMMLPNSTINNTSIYSVRTPGYISYQYLTYHFSFLAIPFFVIAIFFRKNSKSINFLHVILLIFAKDVIFEMLNIGTLFREKHYEMFLMLFQAETFCTIAFWANSDKVLKKANLFLDICFFASFVSIILTIIFNYGIDNRYYALGFGVDGTGYFYALYILYQVFVRDTDSISWFKIILSLIGLLLTGQRSNAVMLIFFLIIGCVFSFKNSRNVPLKTMVNYGLVGLAFFIGGGFFLSFASNQDFFTRIQEVFFSLVTGNVNSDPSFVGRSESILGGLKILINYPLGLQNDYYQLQREIGKYAFPTFPHSSLISDAILWSTPIALFCIIYLIRLEIDLFRMRDRMFWIILFIIIMLVIFGSPEIYPNVLFVRLFFVSIANINRNKYREKVQ